jgi:short-subunit dehydrogenase
MTKTVLITGASLGIGLEFAKIFARQGYDLVLVARSEDKLKALADEILRMKPSVTTHLMVKDLSIAGSGKEIFDELRSKNIQIDVLVNNAGFGDYGLFHESKLDRQLQMIDLNVRSLTELTHLFGSLMVARKDGKILNVASTAAFQPGPLLSVYYATKHFVLAFSEGIANEWKEHGVTVTVLCPGPTESGFQEAANMGASKLFKTMKLPSSQEVAQYGFDAMMSGKVVAVHGTMNKVVSSSVRFMPRGLITKVVRKIQDRI